MYVCVCVKKHSREGEKGMKIIQSGMFVCAETPSFRWEISGDKFIASLKP